MMATLQPARGGRNGPKIRHPPIIGDVIDYVELVDLFLLLQALPSKIKNPALILRSRGFDLML
jgi:hypothetical protein